MAGFAITGGKGFHVGFKNGWTVSVQFGPGNYCQHRDRNILQDAAACGKEGSIDAETAVWGPHGELVKVPWSTDDTVQGWQSPSDVLRLLTWAAEQKATEGGNGD